MLQPLELLGLPKFGIGLTDLVKKAFGTVISLADSDYDIGSFAEPMVQFAPKIIAFDGKGPRPGPSSAELGRSLLDSDQWLGGADLRPSVHVRAGIP
ncbi:hypothetical protein MAE02_51970 [Microvirga aerophila]|uniref:Uncharacterized protein n=1 Tax=Microvirga aerophila TaxID=670291 RepID=A0A512BZW6_9HYPH|nr:hypothetical protein MAE02_51970 [Microvirga aerophila]